MDKIKNVLKISKFKKKCAIREKANRSVKYKVYNAVSYKANI